MIPTPAPMLGSSRMSRERAVVAAAVLAPLIACAAIGAVGHAQGRPAARMPAPGEHPNFSGEWRLNRELNDEMQPGDENPSPSGGSRGGFGGRGGVQGAR